MSVIKIQVSTNHCPKTGLDTVLERYVHKHFEVLNSKARSDLRSELPNTRRNFVSQETQVGVFILSRIEQLVLASSGFSS